jgi:predicted GIY-YIG superfamily endonuclease
MFYVYGLHLEGDDEIRYVGSTCNPQSRLWAHLRDTEKGTPKDLWVKEKLRPRSYEDSGNGRRV